MDDDDLYGEDVFAGLGSEEPAVHGEQRKTQPPNGSFQPADDYGGTNYKLQQREQEIFDLREELAKTQAQIREWHDSFADIQQDNGGQLQNPRSIAKEFQRLRAVEAKYKDQFEAMERREAASQIQLAERTLEVIELRRQVDSQVEAANSNILQVSQFLLEPAINKEFNALKQVLQDKNEEIKQLKEELQAVQFSQESKAGKMLMAKCRALQEENEEMGKELSEGKVHQLEKQIALQKEFVQQLRKNYTDLEDHCHVLDEEAEHLQQQIIHLQRQVATYERGREMSIVMQDRKPKPFLKSFNNKLMGPPPLMLDKKRRSMGDQDVGHFDRKRGR